MRFRVSLLLGLLMLFSASSQAAVVRNIYEAEVLVSGQDRNERHRAVRNGLLTVLIKATGNSEVALAPGVPQLLDSSLKLLQQYRYRVEKRPDVLTGEFVDQELIWLRYDADAIDRALRDIDLAVWPKTRPDTLLWLAIEQRGQRRLYTEQDIVFRDIAEREAARRAIPVTLPLMDLEDQSRLQVSDIWANFQGAIINASKRYESEAVLVGRLQSLAKGKWLARWSYFKDGRAWDWQLDGNLVEVLGGGVDGAADVLAANIINSKPSDERAVINVLVKSIFTVDDYARTDSYLRSLDTVVDVQASQVERDQVMFKLVLRGNSDALERAVRLSDRHILQAEVLPPVVEPVIPPVQPVVIQPTTITGTQPGTGQEGDTVNGPVNGPVEGPIVEPVVEQPLQPTITRPDLVYSLLP